MEEVDIYSNMLYVMNKKAKLGKLAHEYAEIDRNRAEVCCLIGKSQPLGTDRFRSVILMCFFYLLWGGNADKVR